MFTQLGNGYTNATIDEDLYYKLIEELEAEVGFSEFMGEIGVPQDFRQKICLG